MHNTIQSVKRKIQDENRPPESSVPTDGNNQLPETAEPSKSEVEVTPFICLPYKGKEGDMIISKFRDALSKATPQSVKPQFAYKGKKLGSYFRLKDRVPFEHQSDCVYSFNNNGSTKYVGETKVRIETRSHEHCHTDKESSVYKFKEETGEQISQEDFEILEKGYSKRLDRKLAEALYIKELKPVLNEQVKSFKLCLFN